MPELPEVETIARGVDVRVRGDRIAEVWFSRHREPFKTRAARQAEGLAGRSILAVHRTGKHIVCELGSAPSGSLVQSNSHKQTGRIVAQWIVHLGMTGRLLVTTPDAPLAAHTHARLTLDSGRELRFVDPRRFGRLEFRDLGSAGDLKVPVRSLFRSERLNLQRSFADVSWPLRRPCSNQTPPCRRGKHLRRREPLSRGNSPAKKPPVASPGSSWRGCASPCEKYSSTLSGLAVLRFPTMWMPRA